jgi:hypothetical protein
MDLSFYTFHTCQRIESLITIQFISHFSPYFGFHHQYSFSLSIPLFIVGGYGYTVKHFEIILGTSRNPNNIRHLKWFF